MSAFSTPPNPALSLPALESAIRELVIHELNFHDDDLPEDGVLGGDALDLDSLDYLTIVTAVEKVYGIKFTPEELGPDLLKSVSALSQGVFAKLQAG